MPVGVINYFLNMLKFVTFFMEKVRALLFIS
jgi:hypothetical protein